MKTFLKYSGLFSLFLFLFCIAFEYSVRQIPNPFSYKRYLLEEKGSGIKHIVIGSSVALDGIDPACLPDSAYNLAISAQDLRYNKAQLEKYIDCLPNLKSVIWGIGYHLLWKDNVEEGDHEELIAYHNIYMDIRFGYNLLHHSEFLSSGYLSLMKWSKYYLRHEKTMRCDTLGLDYSEELSEKEKDRKKWLRTISKDVIPHNMTLKDEKTDRLFRSNIQRMNDVAKLCHDRGIMLYIVIPPVYREYYKLTNNEQLQQMCTAIKDVADQWDNVCWYNYFNDDRFVEDDFFNGNHLTSDVGAKKFATILRKDIYGME
ncbi:MAG: hypothetical protein LBG18_00675 [Mediterranea sp.]|jgi:hypothetical protein|nr:hypothetical protein [Mediterranea sp.]